MDTSNQYSYINSRYTLAIEHGSSVKRKSTGQSGRVVGCEGAYLRIHWDGDDKPSGPWHPTWDLEHQ